MKVKDMFKLIIFVPLVIVISYGALKLMEMIV
jgi:hypothetical protein